MRPKKKGGKTRMGSRSNSIMDVKYASVPPARVHHSEGLGFRDYRLVLRV
jgi:hypothetical protein